MKPRKRGAIDKKDHHHNLDGYDHIGSVVIALAIAAASFTAFLYMQNQEFLEECARYGGC